MQLEPLFTILVLVFSVILHELAHGYAALRLGDPTARLAGRLTLNPLKHLDWFGSVFLPGLLLLTGGFIFGWAKPVPYNPYNLRGGRFGPAAVAAAGPATNLLIAFVFAVLLRSNFLAASPELARGADLVALIILLNLMLAIFNLLPIPPLDGSKILAAFLPLRLEAAFEQWAARYQWLIIVVALLILLNSDWLSRLTFAAFHLLVG